MQLATVLGIMALLAAGETAKGDNVMSFFDLTANTLDGSPMNFSEFKGKVLVVVNTASECGYTPQYAGLEQLARHAVIVQAKTYYGGGKWYTLDLDYPRIAGILRKAGFRGWVSLEMEGEEDATTAVPKSLTVLRSAFGA